MFLENGARFYIDCGFHPEMTTPECTTPWELARYVKAGERILERLAQDVWAEACGATEIMCFRCHVDYSGAISIDSRPGESEHGPFGDVQDPICAGRRG